MSFDRRPKTEKTAGACTAADAATQLASTASTASSRVVFQPLPELETGITECEISLNMFGSGYAIVHREYNPGLFICPDTEEFIIWDKNNRKFNSTLNLTGPPSTHAWPTQDDDFFVTTDHTSIGKLYDIRRPMQIIKEFNMQAVKKDNAWRHYGIVFFRNKRHFLDLIAIDWIRNDVIYRLDLLDIENTATPVFSFNIMNGFTGEFIFVCKDNKYFIAGAKKNNGTVNGDDYTNFIWSIDSKDPIASFNSREKIKKIIALPNRYQFLALCDTSKVYHYDLSKSLNSLTEFTFSETPIDILAFPDGQHFVVSLKVKLQLWNIHNNMKPVDEKLCYESSASMLDSNGRLSHFTKRNHEDDTPFIIASYICNNLIEDWRMNVLHLNSDFVSLIPNVLRRTIGEYMDPSEVYELELPETLQIHEGNEEINLRLITQPPFSYSLDLPAVAFKEDATIVTVTSTQKDNNTSRFSIAVEPIVPDGPSVNYPNPVLNPDIIFGSESASSSSSHSAAALSTASPAETASTNGLLSLSLFSLGSTAASNHHDIRGRKRKSETVNDETTTSSTAATNTKLH